jgi:hypothetical protein
MGERMKKRRKKIDCSWGKLSYQKNFREKKNRRLAESFSACLI